MRLVILILPLLLCGCGADALTRYEGGRSGVTVDYPADWARASKPLTPPGMDPRDILSVGSFPLRFRHTGCDAWAGSAQQDLGASDAFVSVRETGDLSRADYGNFPARPPHFSAEFDQPPEPSPCPGGHGFLQQLRFSDAGRNFDVLLGFGAKVGEEGRREAYRVLDSLRFDPDRKPGWAASPN
jgi:hypothetical protein